MGQQFVNVTSEPITITFRRKERDGNFQPTGKMETATQTFEPSRHLAEVMIQPTEQGNIDGIPSFVAREVIDLPPQVKFVTLIVSPEVFAVSKRIDVCTPTSPIFDEQGKMIGFAGLLCHSFSLLEEEE